MTTNTFTGVHCVGVPVTDQDRSTALFQQLGFEVRMDAELQPGFRWIEVGPAGGGTSLALVPAGEGIPAGGDTGIRLSTGDARAAHATVRALGLEAGELLDWESAPLMFSFVDHDGNRFYVLK